MAKISKKPPKALPAVEIGSVNQFIFEGIEAASLLPSTEPITHIPNVDVFSTPTELIVEVEIPGVRKEDIDVAVFKNTMTIKALKFECFDEDKITYVCMERAFGRFYRSLDIPFPVDTVKIKAVYKNGILTITIPRVEDKRCATRHVPIESVE